MKNALEWTVSNTKILYNRITSSNVQPRKLEVGKKITIPRTKPFNWKI